MAARRRTPLAFAPDCRGLETRLAPSGNFLSHGLAEASREVKHLEHHRHAEHAAGHNPAPAAGQPAHGHHAHSAPMIPATTAG